MDILLNGANAALHLAHDLRRDVEVGLLLLGPPHRPRNGLCPTAGPSSSDSARKRFTQTTLSPSFRTSSIEGKHDSRRPCDASPPSVRMAVRRRSLPAPRRLN